MPKLADWVSLVAKHVDQSRDLQIPSLDMEKLFLVRKIQEIFFIVTKKILTIYFVIIR